MSAYQAKTFTFYHRFYCHDCQKTFEIPTEKTVKDIPKVHQTQWLKLLASGEKFIWPFDESRDDVWDMERNTVKCPQEEKHIIQFVWRR